MGDMMKGTIAIVLAVGFCAEAGAAEKAELVLACARENDLYQVLSANGVTCRRYGSAAEAVWAAKQGAGLLILADEYPERTVEMPASLFKETRDKALRLYIEFPAALPGMELGSPRNRTPVERAVVSSEMFGDALRPMRILEIHGCRHIPVEVDKPHLVLAHVAGYDTAVYGLPETTHSLLFEREGVLVSTTCLSRFVRGRYGPTAAWEAIWKGILQWVRPDLKVDKLKWTPTVRPSFGRDEKLPEDVERLALKRGMEWFVRSGLFVEPSASEDQGKPGIAGIREAFASEIRPDGTQSVLTRLRSDCIGGTAGAFALAGRALNAPSYGQTAENLLEFVYYRSPFTKGPRANPDDPNYGLMSTLRPGIYYGDDHARALLGTMAVAASRKQDRWNEALALGLLANLRTTGPEGFRGNLLSQGELHKNGWQHYFHQSRTNYAPHYEAHLWACYLWAYRQTKSDLCKQRARSAIRMTMAAYPEEWHWTNGIMQERARMLLPLAWLVRIEDTPRHRKWLAVIADELLALQEECGALREQLGGPGKGKYGPPRSNRGYGRGEATLLQENGDPACDLLYTTNFAFLGLHEAAVATGEKRYREACHKLAEFLCRIQVRSEAHPELDGAWFRAFDFEKWDYWASNSDHGWGVWATETGWTQACITAVLALRQMNTSLWDLTADVRINKHFDKCKAVMLPDAAINSTRGAKQRLRGTGPIFASH